MGLLGGDGGNGIYFFIIMIVLALAVIFVAKIDNNSLPTLDFNSSSAMSMFAVKDLNLPDTNFVVPNLFPSSGSGSGASSGGSNVVAFFCPQDACAKNLIEKIDASNSSIYIAIYSFTHEGIADALIRAKQRGVNVKVVFDHDESSIASSQDERLAQNGVSVALRNGVGLMHNKFAVIDSNLVATGSFNYSDNANMRNEENLVFIENPTIAQEFKTDFDSIWAVSVIAS